jgi:hypothetical protein
VRSPDRTPALRALQFCDVGVAGDFALGLARAKWFEIEENRTEPDAVAFDASKGASQQEDRKAVFQVARIRLDPVRIVTARAVHHKG